MLIRMVGEFFMFVDVWFIDDCDNRFVVGNKVYVVLCWMIILNDVEVIVNKK